MISVLALVGVGAGIKGIHLTTSTFHNCFTSQSILQRWDSNQHLCENARYLRPLISEIYSPSIVTQNYHRLVAKLWGFDVELLSSISYRLAVIRLIRSSKSRFSPFLPIFCYAHPEMSMFHSKPDVTPF